ncbi:MAG TPA: N-acetylmuramoyl-L-alanine amidase [Candidatus Paceibacterota bacterium]|nr:N-acetylmuramoyl-L-alanine amidase [Candidatus Paceibacterota bacterium]
MLDLGKPLAGMLALLVLAGCATSPRREAARFSDLESAPLPAVTLAPAPLLAPPATGVPEMPAGVPLVRPGSGAVSSLFAGNWIPLNRWSEARGLAQPRLVAAGSQPVYALETPGGRFLVRIGSEQASWEGLEVRLGYAPQLIDQQPWMHALDLKKTVQPLLGGLPEPDASARRTIVIDPGHGGVDAGTRDATGRLREKDCALDWALRLRELLAAHGWRVYLTRSNDVEVSIAGRVALAERLNADLFVSLHFNSAAPNETESGLETYCLTPAGLPSNLTRGYSDDAGQVFPNNAYDEENLRLAARVHRELLRVNGSADRGLRRARFLGVLRGQQRPAILVEGGYLSNPREARQIAMPGHRQKLAEAVARALLGNAMQYAASGRTDGDGGTSTHGAPQEAPSR